MLLVLVFVFLLLSLGPTLRVFGERSSLPMPYAALMHVPPFDMARAPQRVAVLGIWGLVSLASLGLSAVARTLARRSGAIVASTATLLALAWWCAEGRHPSAASAAFHPPPVLQRLPTGGVASLPLSIMDGGAMFLQMFHERPIVTGYVSRISERQYEHVERLQNLLARDPAPFAAEAHRIGVRTLILQPGLPDEAAAGFVDRGLHVIDLRGGLIGEPAPH